MVNTGAVVCHRHARVPFIEERERALAIEGPIQLFELTHEIRSLLCYIGGPPLTQIVYNISYNTSSSSQGVISPPNPTGRL